MFIRPPDCQYGAQCGYKRQRLIEHEVVVSLWNSDYRNIGSAQFPYIINRVRCEQQAFLAVGDGLAAGGFNKAPANRLPSLLRGVLTEDFGIKFPGPFLALPPECRVAYVYRVGRFNAQKAASEIRIVTN
jgi:hypothetical protein